jgi:hypothetical protein
MDVRPRLSRKLAWATVMVSHRRGYRRSNEWQ